MGRGAGGSSAHAFMQSHEAKMPKLCELNLVLKFNELEKV